MQMLYLEKNINTTFISGFSELKMMADEADAAEADLAPAPAPTSTPSSASNTTDETTTADYETPVQVADMIFSRWKLESEISNLLACSNN